MKSAHSLATSKETVFGCRFAGECDCNDLYCLAREIDRDIPEKPNKPNSPE